MPDAGYELRVSGFRTMSFNIRLKLTNIKPD